MFFTQKFIIQWEARVYTNALVHGMIITRESQRGFKYLLHLFKIYTQNTKPKTSHMHKWEEDHVDVARKLKAK